MKPKYFLSTPEGGLEFFTTMDEALDAMDEELVVAREHAVDNGWNKDLDKYLFVGEVLYRLEKTNLKHRPDDNQLDEDGYDEDGYDEDGVCCNDIDEMHDYKIVGEQNGFCFRT